MSEKNDLDKLKKMKNGDNVTVNWSEEGGADVYKVNYYYIVFYVPQYGGDDNFEACLDTAEEVIKLAYGWT